MRTMDIILREERLVRFRWLGSWILEATRFGIMDETAGAFVVCEPGGDVAVLRVEMTGDGFYRVARFSLRRDEEMVVGSSFSESDVKKILGWYSTATDHRWNAVRRGLRAIGIL